MKWREQQGESLTNNSKKQTNKEVKNEKKIVFSDVMPCCLLEVYKLSEERGDSIFRIDE
jgi:hypothetical protein